MSDTPIPDPDSDRTIIRPKPGGSRAVPPPQANPFDEAPDADRTIIRPKPGGSRPAAPRMPPQMPPHMPPQMAPAGTPARAAPAAPPQAARPAPQPAPRRETPPPADLPPAEPPPIFTIGTNKLAAIAEPLVLLLARLWNAPTKPFSGDLRESTIEAFRVFERRARETGVPMDQLRPAHYALCAAIDDVVANTPWAASAGWDAGPLTANFHQEARPGERFFEQLAKLSRNPAASLPVIELMHVCLSLGFMGPYRHRPDGAETVERIRRETHDLILAQRERQGGEHQAAELSPHWQGVSAPYVPGKARFPVWVIGAGAIAAVAGLFVLCLVLLDGASDAVYARMVSAPPATMPKITRAALIIPPPPPPPAPEPTAIDRLREALKPEIEKHSVAVLGTPELAVLRLPAGPLFPAGSATPQSAAGPLLQRIAAVLKEELAQKADPAAPPAGLQVVGYTDNQPVRTVKFPSNFKLSAARAEAVREVLQKALGKTPPITADGRADADPIAPNTTAEGRAENSRIEIVLRRQQ